MVSRITNLLVMRWDLHIDVRTLQNWKGQYLSKSILYSDRLYLAASKLIPLLRYV